MSQISEELTSLTRSFLRDKWDIVQTSKVPEPRELLLDKNQGKSLDGAVLYADLAASTSLVNAFSPWFAAAVYESFLKCASKLIRDAKGDVAAFDGDRVMGIFVGDDRASRACTVGLKMKYAVDHIINQQLRQLWKDNPKFNADLYQVRYACGIDLSSILAVRVGVRGDNDITWVGKAANRAAKLCENRELGPTIITSEVLTAIQGSKLLFLKDGSPVWKRGPKGSDICYSTAHIEF